MMLEIGTPPALSLAMRSRSMSVQTSVVTGSAKHAPVTNHVSATDDGRCQGDAL